LLKQIKYKIFFAFIFFGQITLFAQIKILKQDLSLQFTTPLSDKISVKQHFTLVNNDSIELKDLYLLNWVNAYQNKRTDLAKRFMENFDLDFHFARAKNRGFVKIDTIYTAQGFKIDTIYNENELFTVVFDKPVPKNDTISFHIIYQIKLPNKKFTGFGIDKNKNISLDNFYFLPISKNKLIYTHKKIDNYPASATDFTIQLKNLPAQKNTYSNLRQQDTILTGRLNHPVIVLTEDFYEKYVYKNKEVITWNKRKDLDQVQKQQLIQKVLNFYEQNLGAYPYDKIMLSENDFKNYKVYGPDLLPKFLNPFDKAFLWEMEILHLIGRKYLDATVINNRKLPWVSYGIPAYLEYQYLEEFYPNQKLLGKAANNKLVKLYYASQVKMTEKYTWLYLYMARMNKDQSLHTALDSLINFNRNVVLPYKAALGYIMLADQNGQKEFKDDIRQFYQLILNNELTEKQVINSLLKPDENPWIKDYFYTRTKYDYKLKKITATKDSLQLQIVQKKHSAIPLHIYGLKNDSIILLKKTSPVYGDTIINVAKGDFDYIGLNYYNNFPELQIRNNYKSLHHKLFNKPLQIRPYQDFDTPLKNQIFINPFFEYNYYDGIILGTEIYNESVLHNHFKYAVSPSYASKDQSLTGKISFSYTQYFEHLKPYAIKYGFNYKYFHYDHDLAYRRINPYISLQFQNKDLRKRDKNRIVLQYMYIDKDPGEIPLESDQYKIVNLNVSKSNINVIKDLFYVADLQFSSKFSKISGMFRYRFLSNQNQQWDFRIYAGAFLHNETETDYFSFALDRPTDYLFQHHYYGRSESSGIFHQQFIWAEGGFKTFFEDQYANEFIISNNVNIGVYKWFNLYGDWAWKKNRGEAVGFYYDSGIRINLVQDYFEVFFPVYSSLGWEIDQPDYLSKIRMVFTIDLNGLSKMFRRGWY